MKDAQRRWFRFSLATLLLVIAVSSVFLAWMGRQVRSTEKELSERKKTVEQLATIRGRALGWSEISGTSRIGFYGAQFDPPTIDLLKQTITRNPNISSVTLNDTVGTNEALAALTELRNLVEVELHHTDETDEGLNQIAEKANLRRLFAKDKWIILQVDSAEGASSTSLR